MRPGANVRWVLAMAILARAVPASAACDGTARRVVDRGLHRQWIVMLDSAHPERPAKLVEVPWDEAAAKGEGCGEAASSAPRSSGRSASAPDVRPGMRVTLWKRGGEAEIHLAGVALGTGWAGDVVSVRAGWRGSLLRGMIRGPGLVELTTESGGKR